MQKAPLGPEGGPFEGFEPRFEIGRGNYGTVWLLQNPVDGGKAVDKRIRLDTLSDKEKTQALAEIELLRKLKHPHVVNLRHTFISMPGETGPGLWSGRHCELLHILMDYCDGGTLANVLADARKGSPSQGIPLDDAKRWTHQCTYALAHLHENRVLHRDLKPANIFLVRSPTAGYYDIVLGDFGISRVLSPDTVLVQTSVGTPYYMSPEAIVGSGYDGRSDVWSLGVILYELLSLRRPFPATSIAQLAIAISAKEPEPLPESAPPEAVRLVWCSLMPRAHTRCLKPAERGALTLMMIVSHHQVDMCLCKDPTTRPTAAQLLACTPLAGWAEESNGASGKAEDATSVVVASSERSKENEAPPGVLETEGGYKAGSGIKSPRDGAQSPQWPSKVARVARLSPLESSVAQSTREVQQPSEQQPHTDDGLHGIAMTTMPPGLVMTPSFSSDEDEEGGGAWAAARKVEREARRPVFATPWRPRHEGERAAGERAESRGKKLTAARLGRHRRTASAPAVTAAALAQAAAAPAGSGSVVCSTESAGDASARTVQGGGDSPFTRFRPTPNFIPE